MSLPLKVVPERIAPVMASAERGPGAMTVSRPHTHDSSSRPARPTASQGNQDKPNQSAPFRHRLD
jgi:hypothetical protein